MVYLEIYCIFNGIESKGRVGIVLCYILSDGNMWGKVLFIFDVNRIILCRCNLLFLYVWIDICY